MKPIKKYKTVDINEFDLLLKKHFVNDSSFALALGQTKASMAMKRSRDFSINFTQAFTFYARYYMSDADFDFVIQKMKQDGFEVKL